MITYSMPYKIAFENYVLITQAINTPVVLEKVKQYLRIEGTDFDNELNDLIYSATNIAEKITGRDLINKTYKAYLDKFPFGAMGMEIRKSKLQSITSIKYYNLEVLTTWDASNYYNTNTNYYSIVYPKENNLYPDADCRKQAIEIEFVSGYGNTSNDVPDAIQNGLYKLIAYLFENKGDCNYCNQMKNATDLLQCYKLPSLLINI